MARAEPYAQPIEEHFNDLGTGVEAEQVDDADGEEIDRPWRPESIRVSTKTFSLRNVLDFIDEHALELAPDFQRLEVWKVPQKSQLIESILLQIPLPVFYFAEDTEGLLKVVDGLQRLSTIHDFVRGADGGGGFPLKGLEYLDDANGRRYSDLPPKWQRRLTTTQIIAHVIDPSTPPAVKYDIFRRINTGGTPLNAQEIRHCMSDERSRTFLKECAELQAFRSATGGVLYHHPRMVDREAVLRFAAFWSLDDISDYRHAGGGAMDALLSDTTEQLDDSGRITNADMKDTRLALERGCRAAESIFGDYAFRKWSSDDAERRNPFNRAMFESWTVELAKVPEGQLSQGRRKKIAQEARSVMTSDYRYISSITVSTGDPRRVEYRFTKAKDIIAGALK